MAKNQGLEVAWGPNRFLKTRWRMSPFEYCPALKKNVFYSTLTVGPHLHDFYPGVCELSYANSFEEMDENCRPIMATFGGGQPYERQDYLNIRDAYDEGAFPVGGANGMDEGDIVIVCNRRFAHGRPS